MLLLIVAGVQTEWWDVHKDQPLDVRYAHVLDEGEESMPISWSSGVQPSP